MQWASLSEFLAMGGRGFYVWGSYVVTMVFIVIEILMVRHRRRVAQRSLEQAGRLKRLEENESQT